MPRWRSGPLSPGIAASVLPDMPPPHRQTETGPQYVKQGFKHWETGQAELHTLRKRKHEGCRRFTSVLCWWCCPSCVLGRPRLSIYVLLVEVAEVRIRAAKVTGSLRTSHKESRNLALYVRARTEGCGWESGPRRCQRQAPPTHGRPPIRVSGDGHHLGPQLP